MSVWKTTAIFQEFIHINGQLFILFLVLIIGKEEKRRNQK